MANKKLLAIHLGTLGDVVISFTPLLLLKETFSHIDLLCRQSIGLMARYLKVIDEPYNVESATFSFLFRTTPVDSSSGPTTYLRSYDEILLFSFSRDLAENIKKVSGNKVFQLPPRPEPSQNIQVGRYLTSMMVNKAFLKEKSGNKFWNIYQDFRNPGFRGKKILIHPGSGSHLKNWPIQYFLKLERLLSDDGFEPVFILGPAEDRAAEIFLQNGVSEKKIMQLFDLLKLVDVLKTGGAFIGNDSGVSHLAAFIGLPTLVIFGPTQPLRWCPMGRHVAALSCHLDCDPCFETSRKGCDSMECLMGISPEQVKNKFDLFIKPPVPG